MNDVTSPVGAVVDCRSRDCAQAPRGHFENLGVGAVKQCAVLFVNAVRKQTAHPSFLRQAGFIVHELREWPIDERTVRDYHVVIVRVRDISAVPMLAARLRAKPYVDARMLIALVNTETLTPELRLAQDSGFDEVLNDSCDGRRLAARMIRGLRARPQLRCVIPPQLTRSAA